jgi:UDP-N-acetylglucosamine 1-carboxyvinyltransferase
MPSYQYVIEGGIPLKGRIKASGNKNSALPCLAATLLTDQPVVLKNLPEIEDVHVMIDILKALGSTVQKIGHNEYRLHTLDITREEIPPHLAQKIRASILLAGPLLARKGRVLLPPPGGDVIGRRPLDTHFLALMELGVRVESGNFFVLSANKLKGAAIFLDETSVTATENVLMAAVLAEGTTVIENAASEPHVQDLCRMLVSMGARIMGIGSNILTVEGSARLSGTDFRIGSDFMEVGSLIGLAAATREAGHHLGDLRGVDLGARRPGAEDRADHGRTDSEDRRCPVAGIPRRYHQHCPGRGDAGGGDGAHP